MCPERLAHALEALISPYDGSESGKHRFGYDREHSAGLYRAYADALPALALGFRMYSDTTIRGWVSNLSAVDEPERPALTAAMAKGAPRGVGREVVQELLDGAAEDGLSALYGAGTFAAFVVPEEDPPRARKGGEHNRYRGLAETADRIVRALVAYPAGIEPTPKPEAARRAETRLLAAAGRHLGV